MTRLRSQTRYDDWIIYAALLPAVLTLVGVGVTAAVAWHNPALWNAATLSVNSGDADNYVQGVAKHDLVKLPAPEPPPSLDLLAGP